MSGSSSPSSGEQVIAAEKAASLYKMAKDDNRAPILCESDAKQAIRIWNGMRSVSNAASITRNLGCAQNLLANLHHLDASMRKYHAQEAIVEFAHSLAEGSSEERHADWMDDILARCLDAFMYLSSMMRTASLDDKLLQRKVVLKLPMAIQAEAMIEMVASIYNHGVSTLDNGELKEAAKTFAEITRAITEAEQLCRRADCTLATQAKLLELSDSVFQHAYLTQARLAIQRGDEYVQCALAHSEALDMELVWTGLDAYQEACVLARGHAKDIETEAIGVARRGKIYAKVLRSESLARPLLVQASTLATSLAPRSFHGTPWYDECIRQLQVYQAASADADARAAERHRNEQLKSQAPTRKRLKEELQALDRVAKEKNSYQLLEHVYAKYEPKCETYLKNQSAILKKVKDANADTLKKVLRDALTHYHPDKNADHGMEWVVRCEEVYKHLNEKYDSVKSG